MSMDVNYSASAFTQSYSSVIYGDFSLQVIRAGRLAPAANATVVNFAYAPGIILAEWGAAGALPGYYVNWVPGGANGQGVPVGILVDDSFNATTDVATIAGTGNLQMVSVGGLFYLSGLAVSTTGASDLTDAITAMGGTVYGPGASDIQWVKIPG